MLVTPVNRNFNHHKLGTNFELADKAAQVLIKAGLLRAAMMAEEPITVPQRRRRQYKRRDMQAES